MNRRNEHGISANGLPFSAWLAIALAVSALIHALFWVGAGGWPVAAMSSSYFDEILPRPFRIERAEIDPAVFDQEQHRAMLPRPDPVPIPEQSMEFLAPQENGDIPAPSDIRAEDVISKSFTPAAVTFDDVAKTSSVLDNPMALSQTFVDDVASVGFTNSDSATAKALFTASEGGRAMPKFSNLDDLLAGTGVVSEDTPAILMPTDVLFDFNSSELVPAAKESLEKLAELNRRNPQSRFVIEGHTDSIGSDEANNVLSKQRADSVAAWLSQHFNIPSEKLETVGLGRSRLLVPATGNPEEEQLNRRVEIVIKK